MNKICKKCQVEKPIEEFHTYTCKVRGLRIRTRCKACELERNRLYNSSFRERKIESSRKNRQNKIKLGGDEWIYFIFNSRLGQFRVTTKKENLPQMNLTAKFLLSLYHKQNGLCFYTGEKMLVYHGKGFQQRNSMSVDKLDPKKGYCEGNVVLCTNEANLAKGGKTLEEYKNWIENVYSRMNKWSSPPR